jgi:hypothetical protein
MPEARARVVPQRIHLFSVRHDTTAWWAFVVLWTLMASRAVNSATEKEVKNQAKHPRNHFLCLCNLHCHSVIFARTGCKRMCLE